MAKNERISKLRRDLLRTAAVAGGQALIATMAMGMLVMVSEHNDVVSMVIVGVPMAYFGIRSAKNITRAERIWDILDHARAQYKNQKTI